MRRSITPLLSALLCTAVAGVALVAPATAEPGPGPGCFPDDPNPEETAPPHPERICLPDDFQPEGIAVGEGNAFSRRFAS